MKHQYFGDIGDYKKFSLLRTINKKGLFKLSVCWMLTNNDNSSDGRFVTYLNTPKVWSHYDKEVFALLSSTLVNTNIRNLGVIEKSGLLPDTKYFSKILTDNFYERESYFEELLRFSTGADIVFFDPDNGIEVSSIGYGKKSSSKYIFWHELIKTYSEGLGLIVYQHFPRKERTSYINDLSEEILIKLELQELYALRTKHAAFFIIPQPHQALFLYKSLQDYLRTWYPNIILSKHRPSHTEIIQLKNQLDLL